MRREGLPHTFESHAPGAFLPCGLVYCALQQSVYHRYWRRCRRKDVPMLETNRPGFFSRVFARAVEARQRQARHLIEPYLAMLDKQPKV